MTALDDLNAATEAHRGELHRRRDAALALVEDIAAQLRALDEIAALAGKLAPREHARGSAGAADPPKAGAGEPPSKRSPRRRATPASKGRWSTGDASRPTGAKRREGRTVPPVDELAQLLAGALDQPGTISVLLERCDVPPSKRGWDRARQALESLERSGAVEQAGRYRGGIVYQRVRQGSPAGPDDASAGNPDDPSRPPGDDPPPSPAAAARRAAVSKRVQKEDLAQRVLDLLAEQPRSMKDLAAALGLPNGRSLNGLRQKLRGRIETFGSDDDEHDVWRVVPLPADRPGVTVTHEDGNGTLPGRILSALQTANLRVPDLAERLSAHPAMVASHVQQLRRDGEVEKLPSGLYALAAGV